MKLYPKKLNSLEDLERERARVEKEARKLSAEDIFSLESLVGNVKNGMKEDVEEGAGLVSTILQLIPGSNPIVGMVAPLISGWMSRKNGRKTRGKEKEHNEEEQSTQPNIFRRIAVEVIGGYLKWKAVELSYKGVKRFVRSRRERRQPDA